MAKFNFALFVISTYFINLLMETGLLLKRNQNLVVNMGLVILGENIIAED